MKRIARSGVKLAVIGIAAISALTACGTSRNTGGAPAISGAFGSIPAEHGIPSGTGTISMPEFPGVPPTWIFPVVNGQNNSIGSVTLFQLMMWRPLFWSPEGDQQVFDWPLSTGTDPVVSGGGKVFTFRINQAYKWSDGKPLTANDVLFDIALIKAAIAINPSNYAGYVPDQFPLNMTATAVNSTTVQMTFNKVYNPAWVIDDEIGQITPLPSQAWDIGKAGGPPVDWTTPAGARAVYTYLAAQAGQESTYATNPVWQVVDGPFKLTYFNSSTGSFNMVPNPGYGGPYKARFSQLDMIAYTSETAEFDALTSGALTIGNVPLPDLPQLSALKDKGYSVFGYPGLGFNYIPFNFKDTSGHWNDVVAQLYVRQAIASLQDEPAEIKGIFKGAGIPAYGPVASLPRTAYSPSAGAKAPYPFSPAHARQLLSSHGWKVVPGGQTICAKAGTAGDECGAGIPAGTPLSFNLPYATSPGWIGEVIDSLASAAKQDAGITITPQAKTFTFLIQNYNDALPSDAKYTSSWAADQFGGYTETVYPTTNEIFNTGGVGNGGGFSQPGADAAISNSLNSPDADAVKAESVYMAETLPGIFEPENDQIWAWKSNISGPASGFQVLTQYVYNPEELYLTK
jgi:peptide/nickel transport system substrate-binding protein